MSEIDKYWERYFTFMCRKEKSGDKTNEQFFKELMNEYRQWLKGIIFNEAISKMSGKDYLEMAYNVKQLEEQK